jgi:hypothetical protein
VSFSVSDTEHLSSTKDLLLRRARQQLYHSGLYFPSVEQDIPAPNEATTHPSRAVLPLLQDIILFEALDAEQLAELAGHLKPRSEPGEAVCARGN